MIIFPTLYRLTVAIIAAGAVFGGLLLAGTSALAQTELRILTWESYAEDEWIKSFEEEHGVTVSRTYVGSNDEYMAKLAAGGGEYDIVTIVSSLAERAINAGFVEAVDLDKIPNYSQLFPELQAAAFNHKDGEVYGIPFNWGLIPITVNADVIPDRTDRGVLFDPEFAGKIAIWDDVNIIGEVATYLGYDDIWNLTDEQLEAVKNKMIEQKPLVRTYFTNAGEAIDLFLNGEIVMAPGWDYITQALLAEGFPARQFYPDENPIGFVDSNFIVAGTPNRDLAHKLINHMIDAQSQALLGEISGWTPANLASKELMPDEVRERLLFDQLSELLHSVKFWEDIPRRAKYLEILNEVKAAPVQ